MNIKVKASLDAVAIFLGTIFTVVAVRAGLDYIASQIGTENTVNGIIFASMVGLSVFLVGMLYEVRLSQLKYKESQKK
jgi:hypothetical protein